MQCHNCHTEIEDSAILCDACGAVVKEQPAEERPDTEKKHRRANLRRYIAIGERGYTMERYVNCKFGITEADDRLPKRLTDAPQDPKNPKTKVPLEKMKKIYYAARGWARNGIPTEATLRRLKIK